MKKVFLETTINADRHFQSSVRQTKIRSELKGKHVISSKYVIGELNNNFLRNSITFYHLLLGSESVTEALKRMGTTFYSDRQFDRVLKVLSYLAEKVGFDRDELLERLDMLIEEMEILFTEDIEEFVDFCNCARAKPSVTRVGRRWVFDSNCKQQPKPHCEIVPFWHQHEVRFEQIASLPSLAKMRMTKKLELMKAGKIKKYGANCWSVGDAVIALECPDDAEIYTSNVRDFDPICSLLNKTLYAES